MQQFHTSAIRNSRHQAGLTQQQVADHLGVSKATVCGWETGQYDPEPRNGIRLCRLLPNLSFVDIYPLPEEEAA